MSPQDKKFKKDYAASLLKIAQNDLVAAKALRKDPEVRLETVLFHLEQSVEKSLKAVLISLGKPVPLVHDLYVIVQRFEGSDLPPFGYELNALTPFGTIRRYEDGNDLIEKEDVDSAFKAAEACLAWAVGKLK